MRIITQLKDLPAVEDTWAAELSNETPPLRNGAARTQEVL